MRLTLFILNLLGVWQMAFAGSNRMENFSLQHCALQECVIARGHEGFLNSNRHWLSASDVTLEIQSQGRRRSYSCKDFSANLTSDFYTCDNRDVQRESLTVDRFVKIKKY